MTRKTRRNVSRGLLAVLFLSFGLLSGCAIPPILTQLLGGIAGGTAPAAPAGGGALTPAAATPAAARTPAAAAAAVTAARPATATSTTPVRPVDLTTIPAGGLDLYPPSQGGSRVGPDPGTRIG